MRPIVYNFFIYLFKRKKISSLAEHKLELSYCFLRTPHLHALRSSTVKDTWDTWKSSSPNLILESVNEVAKLEDIFSDICNISNKKCMKNIILREAFLLNFRRIIDQAFLYGMGWPIMGNPNPFFPFISNSRMTGSILLLIL